MEISLSIVLCCHSLPGAPNRPVMSQKYRDRVGLRAMIEDQVRIGHDLSPCIGQITCYHVVIIIMIENSFECVLYMYMFELEFLLECEKKFAGARTLLEKK